MDKAPSPASINKKMKSNKLEMAAISSIIGLLLFLFSYYSMSKSEGGGVWGMNLTIEYIFWSCSMLFSLPIIFFGALFTLIFFVDRVTIS